MSTATEEKKKEWQTDYDKFFADVQTFEAAVAPLQEMIAEKNKYFSSCSQLGVTVKKYKASELPRGMFMNNLPKIKAPAYK